MELSLSGGEVAASSGTGEDRISALPDELLLVILRFVDNAADAARTSVLSKRWRPVWTLLPDLRLPFFPEPISFRRALTASQLRLHCLDLKGDCATVESLAIWLPAAARRLSRGTLVLVNHAPEPEGTLSMTPMLSKRVREEMDFLIPCFENAAKIMLDLGFMHSSMPFRGVFAQLTILHLQRVWFVAGCMIGGAGSSLRWCCPCLQVLKIHRTRHLFDVVIHSESLLELELIDIDDHDGLIGLSIEAAALKKLTVVNCFISNPDEPRVRLLLRATVSAPRLEFLKWRDLEGQYCVEFVGQMPHLQSIEGFIYFVYGPHGLPINSGFMKLLQPLKDIESLDMVLVIMEDLRICHYLMEDMKVLPNLAILYLNVHANGHSFGASSFHFLRMCLGIKKLVLVLFDNVKAEAKTSCVPGCVCDEQPNWKTEELMLSNLQEIEIQWFKGSEHEVSFVKRLLNWATTLNKMTITLCSSTTEGDAKELSQMFESLSKPGVCMKLMYRP